MKQLRNTLFFLLLSNQVAFFSFAQQKQDSALADRLDKVVADLMEESRIPGLSLVVIDSGRQLIRTYGFADIKRKEPLTAHTLFQLGSCSKAFTALLIMKLAEEGRIDLNASVSDYIPWFSVSYKDSPVRITILQLLHHTSGISWQTISGIPESNQSNALEQTIRKISGSDLRFLPGKRYEYATVNYDILALVAQKVTNQPFETCLQQSVFDRLQLSSTTIGSPRDSSLLATGYKVGFFRPRRYRAPVYRGNNAAGYVISDAIDMARWLKFQMGLLPDTPLYRIAEKTQQRDETVALHDNMQSYAMGWEISLNGDQQISHGGLNPNYTSYIAFRKNSQLGVAVLANSNSGFSSLLGTRIMKLLAKEKAPRVFKPSDGNDSAYSTICIVLGLYIVLVISLLFKIPWDILHKRREYETITRNKLYKIAGALAAGIPFLYGLYLLPKAMAGFSWQSAIVWSPVSFQVFVLLAIVAMGISYVAYFVGLWFPEQNKFRKIAPKMALMSILSGIANILLIVLITSAIGSSVRLRYLGFYYLLTLSFYVLSQRFVQVNMTKFTVDLVYELKIGLIDKIFATSYQKFEQIDRGRIYTALNDDVELLGNTANQAVLMVSNIFTIAGAFMYLSSLAFWTTLLTILLIAAITAIYYFAGKSTGAYFEQARDSRNIFMRLINGMVDGGKEINLHRNKKREYKADIEKSAEEYRKKIFIAIARYVDAYVIGESMLILLMGIIVFAIPRLFPGIPIYTVVSFVLVVLYLTGPVNGVLRMVPVITQMKVAWRRLKGFTDAIPQRPDAERSLSPINERIRNFRAENIRFKYKKGDEKDGFEIGPVNLEVKSGEILFIIGGNGSGKTTLAMLLTGLYDPDEGRILINDKMVTASQLSECFSAVFNPLFLFDTLYNIDVQNKSEQLKKYLALLNLDKKVEISGNKYSTINLSGGQRKRLALLQCYLEDSPIYLFDEWAADQDPEYRSFFYRTLLPEMKREGKIVIGITHDDHYFDVADKVVKMHMGRLEAYSDETFPASGLASVAL